MWPRSHGVTEYPLRTNNFVFILDPARSSTLQVSWFHGWKHLTRCLRVTPNSDTILHKPGQHTRIFEVMNGAE